MAFVKVLKTRSYFKRFQVQFRRRRDGKTDYYARRRLIIQDRNKYNTPKYRMVVRFSNRDITAQIVSAHLEGDKVLCAAYAHELSKYGLPKDVGVTNYAAAYATGLLLARRSLATLKLADQYKGVAKADGKEYHPYGGDFEAGEGKRNPFKVVLDVGLRRTTTGARIFGVLKGAADGGLNIPHSDNRFPGNMDGKYNAEVHRQHIFGIHIGAYMEELKGDGEGGEEYHNQFSRYIKANLETGKAFEAMYQKVHDTIRKTAVATTANRSAKQAAKKAKHAKDTKSAAKKKRLTCSQRHARAALKIQKGVPWTHKATGKAPAAKPVAKGRGAVKK